MSIRKSFDGLLLYKWSVLMNRYNIVLSKLKEMAHNFKIKKHTYLQTPIRTVPAMITIRKHHYFVWILKFVPAPVKRKLNYFSSFTENILFVFTNWCLSFFELEKHSLIKFINYQNLTPNGWWNGPPPG